jgi:hypothetical protein
MYAHELKKQVEALVKAGIVRKDDTEKAIEVLANKVWSDKIALVWGVEDVIEQAKSQGKRVSKERAREVLQTILHHHDASIGVNWDVISASL